MPTPDSAQGKIITAPVKRDRPPGGRRTPCRCGEGEATWLGPGDAERRGGRSAELAGRGGDGGEGVAGVEGSERGRGGDGAYLSYWYWLRV